MCLLAGGEEGVFRSENGGKTWRSGGRRGLPDYRASNNRRTIACYWLATTQEGGLFASHDCGKTFENVGRIGVDRNLYDIAFDPSDPKRIAVAAGVLASLVSEDGGKTWQPRNTGLPRPDVISVAFDPANPAASTPACMRSALRVRTTPARPGRRTASKAASSTA